MVTRVVSMLLVATALIGCGERNPRPEPGQKIVIADWRQMATAADRERLRNWRATWIAGLDAARKSGSGPLIDSLAPLLDPDAAIDGAVPPPGDYKCRVFKLGAVGSAMDEFTAYKPETCRIEADGAVSSFYKLSGVQRPSGVIFHDSSSRAIFLGTLSLGDETLRMDYGRDAKRDMVGFVERIDDKRWRLVFPSPAFESMIDVVELVPTAK